MHLSSLSLQNFRNIKQRSFDFSPSFTVIFGPNAVGKTNLLEAIYFLNNGHGFREKKLEEIITFEQNECRVEGVFVSKQSQQTYTINLNWKGSTVDKSYFINKLNKNFKDYRKRTPAAVVFQPSDLSMISESPDKRRSFVDKVLIKTSQTYYQAKINYEKGLYKRNKILSAVASGGSRKLIDTLEFWDDFLSKNARILGTERQSLVEFFNAHPELNGHRFCLVYQQSRFEQKELEKIRSKELQFGRTLCGPQIDDFIVYKQQGARRNLALFGSRSEQRLGVLWLKVNELKFYQQKLNKQPLFLMDDIFSELDLENSRKILNVSCDYQTFLTTSHFEVLPLIDFPFQAIELK